MFREIVDVTPFNLRFSMNLQCKFIGKPLSRVSLIVTVHRTVTISFPDFWVGKRVSPFANGDLGRCPKNLQAFEKA